MTKIETILTAMADLSDKEQAAFVAGQTYEAALALPDDPLPPNVTFSDDNFFFPVEDGASPLLEIYALDRGYPQMWTSVTLHGQAGPNGERAHLPGYNGRILAARLQHSQGHDGEMIIRP